jgi:1-acyl-sn-glycerol-3-phosphate acyltransferase
LFKSLYAPSLIKELHVTASGAELLPKPPFLLIADHANTLDPYIIGSFANTPIRYMANIEGVHPFMAAFAGLVGAYGRHKGANDIAALRKTIELARSGESIGIFPEGDRSWDGASTPLRPGAGRLAKRLEVPLVLARQKGNYLSHPRWAALPRRGRWDVNFIVYGVDELARMSDELVEATIAAAVAKNEIKDAIREGRDFSGTGVAEGVGRLLWRCPVCGKADCIVGRADEIRCTRCGTRWVLDANCRVMSINAPLSLHASAIGDLKDWNDWQVTTLSELAEAREKGMPSLRSEGVVLFRRTRQGLRRLGRGRLFLRGLKRGSMKDAELVFEAPEGNVAFKAEAVHGFIDNFNTFSEFDHCGERWRLEFGGGNAAKWTYAFSGRIASRKDTSRGAVA